MIKYDFICYWFDTLQKYLLFLGILAAWINESLTIIVVYINTYYSRSGLNRTWFGFQNLLTKQMISFHPRFSFNRTIGVDIWPKICSANN